MTPTIDPLYVACLCAQWCGVCRDYRALFDEAATSMPGVRFEWIDVEDHADWVDPVEVENFPTLLIASQGRAVFFGTVTPHKGTLLRLVEAHRDGNGAVPDAAVAKLVQRLAER
jgi:thioredoxin 1